MILRVASREVCARGTQMPFANMSGVVTGLFESFRQSEYFQRQMISVLHAAAVFIGIRRQGLRIRHILGRHRLGHTQPGGRLPRHDAGAGGGAQWCCRIAIGETHALAAETRQVRSVVVHRAVWRRIGPAHVINQNHDHVGFCRVFGGLSRCGSSKGALPRACSDAFGRRLPKSAGTTC